MIGTGRTIVIDTTLLITFGAWEAFGKQQYLLMPMKFFRNRVFLSLVTCATVASMFDYSIVLLWPQQVASSYTTDCMVPNSTALGRVCTGGVIRFFGSAQYWLAISAFGMVAFVFSLVSLAPSTKGMGIAFTILGPFFVGFTMLEALFYSDWRRGVQIWLTSIRAS
ncbi:hypothetical protein K432DRAFT_408870 [Lepidopterella palustris CBS 459.81]|uniref:Uncharacterized protein n=1 Tax=Lepidopterella palustris CBS 459.81 TaxID=1314670 RepID=A0A8E2E1H0_9PEZI|nr:hypothetical protein K432DRAFT_408870 [Lepidopterella palustris CBS 459.81]